MTLATISPENPFARRLSQRKSGEKSPSKSPESSSRERFSQRLNIKNGQQPEVEEQSFVQDVAQSPGTQVALGLTQAFTSPLDLTKMYLQGEALAALEEAEEASARIGRPFDKEKVTKDIMGVLENFPTQSLAEEFFREKTGVDTRPKDFFSKVIRGASEFLGLSPKGIKAPKLKDKLLTTEGRELRETGEEFGLRKFAGMESEKPPGVTPIVSPEKQQALAGELGETTKKAIDDIISQKIPIKNMRDKGINLENAYTVAFDATRKTAAEMGSKPIDYSNVIGWIEKEIGKIKSTAPSLSDSQKAYVNILKKERKSLTEKHLPDTIKKINADQALNQYQNFNSNVKGIWRKPEFAGVENAVKNAYAGLNEQLVEAISKANPKLGNELKFANKVFHETSKLEHVEQILEKSFVDGYNPKQLAKTLGSKRDRKFLERYIGKDSITDLERIAKYGKSAEDKVFKYLQNPQTVTDFLSKMTPAQLALLVGYKGHVGALYYLPKAAIRRLQGLLFTRNSTKKSYVNFLKEAAHLGKNPAPLILSGKELQKSIEEEFGSEEELLQMANAEDQSESQKDL